MVAEERDLQLKDTCEREGKRLREESGKEKCHTDLINYSDKRTSPVQQCSCYPRRGQVRNV